MSNQLVSLTDLSSPYSDDLAKIRQRQKMAELLQQQGDAPQQFSYNGIQAFTPPTSHLAKMARLLMGAYESKKGIDEEKELGQKVRSDASGWIEKMAGANGSPSSPGVPAAIPGAPEVPQNPGSPALTREQRMAALMQGMQNPLTSQAAQALFSDDMQQGREQRQNQFTLGRDKVQNDFSAAQAELTRAQQIASQDKSIAAQQALQAAQQKFAVAQQAAQQQFQAGQQQSQQNFTGQQNDLNRDLQKKQLEAAKIPAGYVPGPAPGSVVPMPGSPQAQEAAEIARTKNEQVVTTDRMMRSIDELINSPGREAGTGFSSVWNVIPGTEGATFKAKLETLKSQAFLPAVAQLKGMGALSDAEGKKLTAAIGALDTGMKEADFLASLNQIKEDLQGARSRMAAPPGGQSPQSGAQPSAPKVIDFKDLP